MPSFKICPPALTLTEPGGTLKAFKLISAPPALPFTCPSITNLFKLLKVCASAFILVYNSLYKYFSLTAFISAVENANFSKSSPKGSK